MQLPPDKLPLIVILGPTAVGKTKLSLQLAKKYQGEIISADSRLFYRGMDIGTAKPSKEELQIVPHHLIDVTDPDDTWSLGRYKDACVRLIDEIHRRGNIPFLVGGTGQYIRAITDGWVVPKLSPDERLREVLNEWGEEIGAEALYERLKVIDPEAAEKILPGNMRRMVRALEVIFKTGQKFSSLRKKEPVPYNVLQIGLDRPRHIIDERIDARVDEMMQNGFLEEVAHLLAHYSKDVPSMTAIGYSQLAEYLEGSLDLDEAVEEIKKVTRKFYRRQMTWFKKGDERIDWFDLSEVSISDIDLCIQQFLSE